MALQDFLQMQLLQERKVELIWVSTSISEARHTSHASLYTFGYVMSNVKCVTLSACILFTRHTYILSVRTRDRSLKDTENTDTYTTHTHAKRQTDRQTGTLHINGQSYMGKNTNTNAASCLLS